MSEKASRRNSADVTKLLRPVGHIGALAIRIPVKLTFLWEFVFDGIDMNLFPLISNIYLHLKA